MKSIIRRPSSKTSSIQDQIESSQGLSTLSDPSERIKFFELSVIRLSEIFQIKYITKEDVYIFSSFLDLLLRSFTIAFKVSLQRRQINQ
jgi:hypothetical protein